MFRCSNVNWLHFFSFFSSLNTSVICSQFLLFSRPLYCISVIHLSLILDKSLLFYLWQNEPNGKYYSECNECPMNMYIWYKFVSLLLVLPSAAFAICYSSFTKYSVRKLILFSNLFGWSNPMPFSSLFIYLRSLDSCDWFVRRYSIETMISFRH